ncbi:MAG: XdhC family protein, partial [Opitutales bacterium]
MLDALAARPEASAVLATLVSVEGSFYRRPGARLLLIDGTAHGSISAGCLEEDIRLRAERVAQTGAPEIVVYDATRDYDLLWGLGHGCEGTVRILLERVPPSRPRWLGVLAANQRARRATDLVVVHDGPAEHWGTRLAEEWTG